MRCFLMGHGHAVSLYGYFRHHLQGVHEISLGHLYGDVDAVDIHGTQAGIVGDWAEAMLNRVAQDRKDFCLFVDVVVVVVALQHRGGEHARGERALGVEPGVDDALFGHAEDERAQGKGITHLYREPGKGKQDAPDDDGADFRLRAVAEAS